MKMRVEREIEGRNQAFIASSYLETWFLYFGHQNNKHWLQTAFVSAARATSLCYVITKILSTNMQKLFSANDFLYAFLTNALLISIIVFLLTFHIFLRVRVLEVLYSRAIKKNLLFVQIICEVRKICLPWWLLSFVKFSYNKKTFWILITKAK